MLQTTFHVVATLLPKMYSHLFLLIDTLTFPPPKKKPVYYYPHFTTQKCCKVCHDELKMRTICSIVYSIMS